MALTPLVLRPLVLRIKSMAMAVGSIHLFILMSYAHYTVLLTYAKSLYNTSDLLARGFKTADLFRIIVQVSHILTFFTEKGLT